ncbi:SGNH/GDSL hydrolase family protein [Streptomyces sp. MUM 178J]|uniref:SGNH/GDSL hydrolase family protein n=1 Tax=Streptomyces sp. MUM 178J TaxID=2791991 RepID=UPI001F04541B|nr:SGNH/GDSL hydrolase family protein [Streptomyces sp. MUM 178J]WRQ79277.1 SGNH/GDSL hydrolase family protein [Streptomyces sp. MUM 178J]
MTDPPRARPSAVAASLAGLLLAVGAVTGCDTASAPDGSRGTAASARPSPSPTPVWDRSPDSVAAVGDSITRGFDACGVLSDCPEVSWATGTDASVRSLAVKLLGPAGAAERSWNFARSGAAVGDLAAQMTRAAEKKPELVTVLAGANDACRATAEQMTPVAEFRSSFEKALAALRRASPKSQVYVASVPDLKRLWSTGRGHPLGRRVWKLGVCASMLADAEDDGPAARQRRATVRQRVVDYNAALEDVCARDRRCRYDGGAVFDFPFTREQLSRWDLFHPGKDGQQRLAEIAYRGVTAAEPSA